MFRFDVVSAGDAAIYVQLPPRIDPAVNAWCVALAAAIRERLGHSVLDVVIGYCSVTAYFNPLTVDARWLEYQVRGLAAAIDEVDDSPGPVVEVPVCYGGDYGPDIDDVSRFAALSVDEVIARHADVVYRVYLLGFVPGFAYMAEVDARIAAPRRATPRTAVPPGAVAIAGGQTGVYPSVTPGGWNIIGRTPARPFDRERGEPFLFKPGDRVKFVPIPADEFGRS